MNDDDDSWGGRTPTERTTRRRLKAESIPIVFELENTDAREHFTRDWDDDDRAVFGALGRSPDEVAPFGMLIRERNSRVRALHVMADYIRKLSHRQEAIEHKDNQRIGAAKKLFWSALGTLVLGIGTFVGAIWHRAAKEGADEVIIQQLQEDVKDQRKQLERAVEQLRLELWRRPPGATNAVTGASALSMKGKTP